MITGDHPQTAQAIAQELGLGSRVMRGADLERMSEQELAMSVDEIDVYARVSPEHKLRIVDAFKRRGQVVAMTGDGVNDAPALRAASIGVAMGRSGTEVARQGADIVLADDNFATIVAAIREGRVIYGNIRRTIIYLLTGNFAEVLVMLLALIVAWPPPLLPIHLLWINLVTDGFPALALAASPAARQSGFAGLRAPSERSFFDRWFYLQAIGVGVVIAVLATGLYWYGLPFGDEKARTLVFTFLVFEELLRSFSATSDDSKLVRRKGGRMNRWLFAAVAVSFVAQLLILRCEWLRGVFRVGGLSLDEIALTLGLALTPLVLIEIWKGARSVIVKMR
jgi:Ca2+-transporting ATPase